MNWNRLVMLCALGAPLLTSACAVGGDTHEEAVGVVSLPLRVESNGFTYQLMNANVTVIGTQTQTYSANPSDAILELTLGHGDYLFRLEPGWQLQRIDQNGATENLSDAVLTSPNPMAVTVENQQTVQVLFSFDVSGETIEFGNGDVEVGIEVCDGTVCTNSLPGQSGTGGGSSGPGCLGGNPAQTGQGVITNRFGTLAVSRNGVPYSVQANGWGSGWLSHDIGASGTAMTVNFIDGESEGGAPLGAPTVGCGQVLNGALVDCGLPRLTSELESLWMGLSWTPGSGDQYGVFLEALLGRNGNTQSNRVASIRVALRQTPDTNPIGSLIGSVTLAGQGWNIWGGSAGGISVVTFVPVSGQSSELEVDMLEFIELMNTTINYDRVLGASMSIEAFGFISGVAVEDFCVAAE